MLTLQTDENERLPVILYWLPNTALYYRLSQSWHYRPNGMHYTFCRDLSWAV